MGAIRLRDPRTGQTVPVIAPSGGGVTDHGALTGLADDDHPQYHNDARGDARYVNVSGDTMTGPLTVQGKFSTPVDAYITGDVKSLVFQGANSGVYWAPLNRWLTQYGQGGDVGMADGDGNPRPLRTGPPSGSVGAHVVTKDYLWNSHGCHGFTTGKVGGGTTIYQFQLGPIAYDAWLNCQFGLMGGYQTTDSNLSLGVSPVQGITNFVNWTPGQDTFCHGGRWAAVNGGFRGLVPGGQTCIVNLVGWTSLPEGAYWTGALNWSRL